MLLFKKRKLKTREEEVQLPLLEEKGCPTYSNSLESRHRLLFKLIIP